MPPGIKTRALDSGGEVPMNPESPEYEEALRQANAAGAHPQGVPLRIYGGYLEARAALKANAHVPAIRVLEWLLGHLAEEQGAPKGLDLAAKLKRLRDDGAISQKVEESLFDAALSKTGQPEQAWALISIAEHAFGRLYLARR
jgi:hypothetical protein